MKTILKFYPLVFFIILLSSCNKSNRENDENIITIDLTQELTPITPIVVDEIKLVTDSDDFIGHISKFVPTIDGFYIMDVPKKTVWKFSETGEIRGKLHNIGNGPGEYVNLNEIDVYPNGDLAVHDLKTNKIHRYDQFFNFISSIEIPGKAGDFIIGNDTSYF